MAHPLDALPDLSHLDDDSAELILRLHLEDVETFKEQRKGKQKEGDVDDGEYAATLLEQDLHKLETVLSDRRMTKSIANALQSDGNVLEESAQQEQTACEDRELARRLSGNPTNSDAPPPEPEPPIDDVTLPTLTSPHVSEETGHALASQLQQLQVNDNDNDGGAEGGKEEEQTRAEGSNGQSRRGLKRRGDVMRVCVACQELKPYFDILQVPCQHEYCIDCIRDLFNTSLTDETLFPPKCCRTLIPVTLVAPFMQKDLEQTFAEKEVEFSTANRTYCSRPTCSAFINPANISNNVATCEKCATQTCALCKAAAHSLTDCPEDPNMQAVLELARDSGWQRCNACGRVVELHIGCNHMTCRCGAQFCYECGVRWKLCLCPQWHNERLLLRADQLVERDAPGLAANDPARARQVQQAANLLRERHICAHTDWDFIPGRHRCEECAHTLPNFIFECAQCRIRVCRRCRDNRL